MVRNGFNFRKDILLIIHPPERPGPDRTFRKLRVTYFFNIGLWNDSYEVSGASIKPGKGCFKIDRKVVVIDHLDSIDISP